MTRQSLSKSRTSKIRPCRICAKTNGYCLHLDEIGGAICMFVELPGSIRKDLKSAGIGFQYNPSFFDPSLKNKKWEPRPKPVETKPDIEIVELAIRDKVYKDMTYVCGLTEEHRDHLLNIRRLPESMLSIYCSLPDMTSGERAEITEALTPYHSLKGVPGFFSRHMDKWEIAGPPGILIPYRTRDGQVQGFQIRRNENKTPRYIWLSTPPDKYRMGTPSGAFINFGNWKFNTPDLWICEGGLKADIAAAHTGESFVGVPGAYIGDIEPLIQEAKISALPRFILCPDADFRENWHVWTACMRNIEVVSKYTDQIRIAVWDPDKGKGIDDYILNTNQLPKHISPRKWKEKFREPPRPNHPTQAV